MSVQPANRRSPKPPARKLPPARVLQKMASCHIMVTWAPTGEQVSLPELARRHGLRPSLLRDRWNRAGRPEVVGEALVRPKVERNQDKVSVDYPPHGRIGFAEIRAIHADMGRSSTFFFARWRRAGCPQVVTAEMFTEAVHHGNNQWTADDDEALAAEQLKAQRAWAALSSTENTGAGRGEIPDEEWARMGSSVRSTMAGMSRRTTISSGRVIQKFWTGNLWTEGD